jgi:hypothetical protein
MPCPAACQGFCRFLQRISVSFHPGIAALVLIGQMIKIDLDTLYDKHYILIK